MPSMNWTKIMNASKCNIEDDCEVFFEMIKSFDGSHEKDIERMKKLFEVTRDLILLKNDQLEEVIINMEVETKKDAKKEQRLQAKIKEMEHQLNNLKRSDSDGDYTSSSTKYLQEEINHLNNQIHHLTEENMELQRDLDDEKRASERYNSQIIDLDREKAILRQENDQMRQDISDYKMQLQSQRDNLLHQKEGDLEYKEKVLKKNRQLGEAMEELQNLTDANEDLKDQVEKLTNKLTEAVKDIEQATEEYLKVKKIVDDGDNINDKLREENEFMKSQLADLMEKLQVKSESDDSVMLAVNEKVNDWKKILAEKDQDIASYQGDIMNLRKKLEVVNLDADRSSLITLTSVIEERDQQIYELTEEIKNLTDEMDSNAALIEDLKNDLTKKPKDHMFTKVREQKKALSQTNKLLKDAEKLTKQAEHDALEKDKHLVEALERMSQYESGEYGLAEAVNEIKELKHKLTINQRDIEEFVQHINRNEETLRELTIENELLRTKLGMDPKKSLNIKDYQTDITVKKEEQRALNIVLQKEIERLEEERILLKQNLRKFAQQTGRRAVALGLTADDMVSIQNYTEGLKIRNLPEATAEVSPKISEVEDLKMKHTELSEDLKVNSRQLEGYQQENIELKTQNKKLKTNNTALELALKEINKNMKKTPINSDEAIIKCPSLDKILANMQHKPVSENQEVISYFKEQIKNLETLNNELRLVFKDSRHEANVAKLEAEKAHEKVKNVEHELSNFQQQVYPTVGKFQPLALSEDIPVSSSELIASQNEQLIITLEKLHLLQEQITQNESSLESYHRKFAVMRHQQGLLYADHIKSNQEHETEITAVKEKQNQLEEINQQNLIKLQEFDRLQDTLAQNESEISRRLSEQSRRITVLLVNEKSLTRSYNTMAEMEKSARKEISKLKNDIISMEKAVTEKIGYLQRFKYTATYKINALQKALEDSVATEDFDKANKEYQNLTENYRDLLEREHLFVSKSEAFAGLEEEVCQLKSENEHLKKMLELEKDKVNVLSNNFDKMKNQDMKSVNIDKKESQSEILVRTEMNVLHEKQRAEHATQMYDKSKFLITGLEKRIKELEQNLLEVSQVNNTCKKSEQQLREELESSVTKNVSESDFKRIAELEENEVQLKAEISKLKEIADVATSQVLAFESQQISRDKEVLSLRQQLLDFQAQSDNKTVIGKLHRQIVQLQVSEGTATQKLANELRKVSKLEAQVLQLEQQIDAKNQTIYHNRIDSQNKIKQLKMQLSEVQRQYAGSVTLSKQEKFANNMIQLQEDKLKIENELVEVKEQRSQVEDKLAELELLKLGQEELKQVTIKGGHEGAKKVAQWHSKMEVLRLSQMKQSRQITKLQEQITLYEKTIKNQEMSIADLERKNVKLSKEFEKHQLDWEFREQQLEKVIGNMEKQASDITSVAAHFGKSLGSVLDTSQPVAVQLENAIATIKQNMKEISDAKAQSQVLKKRVDELQLVAQEAEANLIAKDKLIAEIRLQMPATVDRDIFIKNLNVSKSKKEENSVEDHFETQQAIKVAHCAVSSLKARIQLKEESIKNLQDLLKNAHEDMEKMTQKHFEELQSMQLKMQENADRSYIKFKEAATELVNKPNKDEAFKKQMIHMSALEDLIAERDDAMSGLVIQIKTKNEEILALRVKLQQIIGEKDQAKEELLRKHDAELSEKNKEREILLQHIKENEKEIQILKEEISSVKEANSRAPNVNLVRITEQLRNQLLQKENQIQALNKALSKIRVDLLEQTELTTQIQQSGKQQEAYIKKKVDKQTENLSGEIEEIRSQNEKLKIDLKKKTERENNLQSELEDVREKLEKKTSLIQKLKQEKQQLNHQISELEKRIERMKVNSQKSQENEGQELSEMRRRVLFLEEETKARQQQAEKPYEQMKVEKPKNIEVIKWEEKKKWEKTVDKMKGKIKDCESENEKLQKEVRRLKTALDRSNRDKEAYENITKSVSKGKTVPAMSSGVDDLKHVHEMEQLKELNFKQTEEISKLNRRLSKHEDQMVKEVAEENKHLLKRVEEFKKALDSKFLEGKDNTNCREYQILFEKNHELQKQLLLLSKENIEIHFEMEEAKKDVPRLKARVDDLQTYIEALKAENKRLSGDKSEITKVGESGKSPKELEKIIALLKKVVDRVQSENEQLKKSSTAASVQGQEKSLKQENLDLVQKVKNLEKILEQYSADKNLIKEKGTTNMTADFEKLRKDLLKETELKMKLKSQVERLQEEQRILKHSVEESGRKSSEQQVNRVKKLEEDLENKRKIVTDLKTLLRESAEREQYLLQEKQELFRKIKLLESIPNESITTDAALNHAYRKAKLTISELQSEKNELFKEVKLLQQKLHGEIPKLTEDMLIKARRYDTLISKNTELTVQLKTLKFEKEKQSSEVSQLKDELKNFGPEFFEEIEDLKYNYKEAMKKLALYENKGVNSHR